MQLSTKLPGIVIMAFAAYIQFGNAQTPVSVEFKARLDAKVKLLQSWSTAPEMVAAVKAHNAKPSANPAMTNEKRTTML